MWLINLFVGLIVGVIGLIVSLIVGAVGLVVGLAGGVVGLIVLGIVVGIFVLPAVFIIALIF